MTASLNISDIFMHLHKINACLLHSVQKKYRHFWQIWKQISSEKDFISWVDSAQIKYRESGGVTCKMMVWFDCIKYLVLFCSFHGFFCRLIIYLSIYLFIYLFISTFLTFLTLIQEIYVYILYLRQVAALGRNSAKVLSVKKQEFILYTVISVKG